MKGDPKTMLAEMMAKLKTSGEGAKVVPRSPNIPMFGPNPTQPVMATPGEKVIAPEIVRQPGMFSLLNNLNEGGGLRTLYDTVAKPIQAFTVAMSMWGAMAGPANLVESVYSGETNPLDAAIRVAENVTRLRKNKGDEDVGMSLDQSEPVIGRMGGGSLNWAKGGNAIGPTDTQPTLMDPGSFVLNKDASEKLVDWDDSGGGSIPEPPSNQGGGDFDLSKIQNIMSLVERFRPQQSSNDRSSWNPEFHQALYGSAPRTPGPNIVDDVSGEIKKRAMVALMAAGGVAALGAGVGVAGAAGAAEGGVAGGELGGLVNSLFGSGGGDIATIGKLMGMMGGGGSGGGGEMSELIRMIAELVQTLKGQQGNEQSVSNPTNPMWGPTAQPGRRQQGSNYGAIARNTGR